MLRRLDVLAILLVCAPLIASDTRAADA